MTADCNCWLTDAFLNLIFIIGSVKLVYTLANILHQLWRYIRKPHNLVQRYGQGSWAVVTGASDGIGQGFCYQLAKQGLNVCLISRTLSKLEAVERNIKNINKSIQTRIISCDFVNSAQPGFFNPIEEKLRDLDISLLVNNVGVATQGLLLNLEDAAIRDGIVVNSIPMVVFTRRLIERLLKRNSRSGIINLSSIMGTWQFPCLSIYAGTKGLDDLFSRGLSLEYGDKLDILSLRPLYVTSSLTKKAKGFAVISPEQCAQGALNVLGFERFSNGHWFHRLQFNVAHSLPKWIIFSSSKLAKKKKQQTEAPPKI